MCVQDDLCSFSSFKSFTLCMHESNLKINQTKTDHPSFLLNIVLDPVYVVRLAASTEQTWTCRGMSDPHPEGRGPHQKTGTQTEALAVPRASCTACMCTLQFCCVKSPADFHTVQTLSPGKQWRSFSRLFPTASSTPCVLLNPADTNASLV